jgi:hypothetical protein
MMIRSDEKNQLTGVSSQADISASEAKFPLNNGESRLSTKTQFYREFGLKIVVYFLSFIDVTGSQIHKQTLGGATNAEQQTL